MKTSESYFKILQSHGTALSEINPGSKEIAIPKEYALVALDILKESGAIISGGDVVEKYSGRLRYTYDNWSYQKKPGETPTHQSIASCEEARSYISAYNSRAECEPLFVFVLSNKP